MNFAIKLSVITWPFSILSLHVTHIAISPRYRGRTHAYSYLQGLFALANDSSDRVRKEVVSGLVACTSTMVDKLKPFMGQLVVYMLASNEHSNSAVALAAAEFWTAYLDQQLDPGLLRPYLSRLIPVLLKNMVSA